MSCYSLILVSCLAELMLIYGRPAWQMRTLYFRPLVTSFFSSLNLSRRRLDVCHTSTDGVALVRISNAGLKRAARGSLKIQDAKIRHLGIITQVTRAIS